jgi:hypothetical protein
MFLSVDMEILTPFGCASGCTWLLQGVKISISMDRNINNLYYYAYKSKKQQHKL